MSIVATPAYGLAPQVTLFVPPVALAALGLALLLSTNVKVLAWRVLVVLCLLLLENVGAIVAHEIGWAVRQGAQSRDAVLSGLAGSLSRLPYWLALAFPVVLAVLSVRIEKRPHL
ncbi:MAG: hypothetical protein ACT4P4_27965 [Betaproteobacteria bacterium]